MAIPPPEVTGCLPPHKGDPRIFSHKSPFRCDVASVATRFGTTDNRRQILAGFLSHRRELRSRGIFGFQWLDGSFLEDVEHTRPLDPAPKDIDVITFAATPNSEAALESALLQPTNLLDDIDGVKATYHVDHYAVSLFLRPDKLVEWTQYWSQLFSHRRDRLWKGMLVVALVANTADDDAAAAILGVKP